MSQKFSFMIKAVELQKKAVIWSIGKKLDCNIDAKCYAQSFNSLKHNSKWKSCQLPICFSLSLKGNILMYSNYVNQFSLSLFSWFFQYTTTSCERPLCCAPRVVAYERVDCTVKPQGGKWQMNVDCLIDVLSWSIFNDFVYRDYDNWPLNWRWSPNRRLIREI